MDRLFGKELSNILNHGASSRQRNQVKMQSRSHRGITLNDIRLGKEKSQKPVSQNVSLRISKTERALEEKESKE